MIIRFVSGGGWDSRLIEWGTDCEWSHVEAVRGSQTFGAQLKGGVKWRSFLDPCYSGLVKSIEVKIDCPSLQESRFWSFMAAQAGKDYDWRAIPAFVPGLRWTARGRTWRDDDRWFCSELVLAALEDANLVRIPDDTAITSYSPRDAWVILAQRSIL